MQKIDKSGQHNSHAQCILISSVANFKYDIQELHFNTTQNAKMYLKFDLRLRWMTSNVLLVCIKYNFQTGNCKEFRLRLKLYIDTHCYSLKE